MSHLQQLLRIPTSGARAVETFELEGDRFLAIPQLALDVPGTDPDMNGGDSSPTTVLLLRSTDGGAEFAEFQRLPAPGGEDAEFFRIGGRAFLAIASIRNGSGPYEYAQPQRIFEWTGTSFELFQTVDGYAAKQWKHFVVGERHFLGLAQGVGLPGHAAANQPSRIYEWDGARFAPFQDVDSVWGYNWHAFSIGAETFLAYADHVRPSVLLRWTGRSFEFHQELANVHGRAFADFERGGRHYLAVARLLSESYLLRWDGARFEEHQTLAGPAAREFALIEDGADLFLLRVNFITGTPHDPVTELASPLYRWSVEERLEAVDEIATTGGTDAAVWSDGSGDTLVAVSNSLDADVRFSSETVIYRFSAREKTA